MSTPIELTGPFTQLPLQPTLLDGLTRINMTNMTQVQGASLPIMLDGADVVVQAKTGSGKTLAFALAMLNKITLDNYNTQALVLCPTRELADQVAEQIRKVATQMASLKVLTLCGGVAMGPQIASLTHSPHIVVGTPGRVMDHVLKKRLNLSLCQTLVLDEADRMLDMGFADELDAIFANLPQQKQSLLFSATYPPQIEQMSQQIQKKAQIIKVDTSHVQHKIQQTFYQVEAQHKTKAVAALLTEHQPQAAIVFCNTKIACQKLAEELFDMGFAAVTLHGDLEQRNRTQVLARFSNHTSNVLVATDVAARGLDIQSVDLVVSYQIAEEADVHTHRIGRTGRADAVGKAISLSTPSEERWVALIEEHQDFKANWKSIASIRFHANRIVTPDSQTVLLDGGKKHKISRGDVLGALTKDANIPGDDIGKIKVTAIHTYVAVKERSVKRVINHTREGKIKGRRVKGRKLSGLS